MFVQKYGPWALVTGAAMGLGAEFARQLALRGLHIIAVDCQQDILQATVQSLRQQTSVNIRPICLDLSRPDFMQLLLPQIADCTVGLLVNNAGISKLGYFAPQSSSFLLKQHHVNTTAVLLLSHYFAQKLQAHKKGGIIIVSSAAAELSSAYNAAYSASKAYDLKLAESLWAELQPYGVDVLGFIPGPTKTPGYLKQGGAANGSMAMTTQQCVKQALTALGKSPHYVAGTWSMRLGHLLLTRLSSTSFRIKVVSQQIKKLFKIY